MNQIGETVSSVALPARNASLAPAWDLLRAASLADAKESDLGRIRGLLGQSAIDWEAVLRLADNHGTSSLVYQNFSRLGGLIPASVLAGLRQRYETNVRKSLFLARELIRVLDSLDAPGIDAIPYKGVVFSEVYYGDMTLRQPGDIDLFVRQRDVVGIKKAVRELGYKQRVPIPAGAEDDFIASGYEYSFDSSAGRGVLEIQWALQPRFYAVDFDMEELFERAVWVTVAGRKVKAPCAEDLLLALSVHAAKHVWGRLIWLCDIAQILKRKRLNWDGVRRQARNLGIERILYVTLLLAKRLSGAGIPWPVESAILADPAAAALAEEVAASLAAEVSYDVETVGYFRLMMRLRERRGDRFRFLARLILTPGPGEWEKVSLPKVFSPLYRVVRLARLAGRFARRS